MEIVEIFLISVGLAMDAFAVAICKGLAMKKREWKKSIIIGIYFGTAQALMPIIGYLLGNSFEDMVIKIDHWIAFALLSFIGINMIKEAFSLEKEKMNDSIEITNMMILSIATSIDAMAVGITFAFLNVNIITSAISIGIITFILSFIGVNIGNKFGDKYEKKAEFIGGAILILMGTKILLEHLGYIQI